MSDRDVVLARQRAGEIAGLMGFDSHDQTRLSTAVSEAVRDCLHRGGVDEISFAARDKDRGTILEIRIRSSRMASKDVSALLTKTDEVENRLSSGMTAAKRLMDEFRVESDVRGGAAIALGKYLPPSVRVSSSDVERIADQIARREPRDAMEEVRQQNQELVIVLEEVRKNRRSLSN